MINKHYVIFKHRVRMKLPKSLRFATVCRKCRKEVVSKKCFTCKIEGAIEWGRAW